MHLNQFTSSLKSNILFIINPVSGGKNKQKIPALIGRYLDSEKFCATFAFTAYAGHAAELVDEAVQQRYDSIIAVGGDGTVNEIAGKLAGSNIHFGIIPLGSGNGLARSLHIPLNLKKAVAVINRYPLITIDGAILNNRYFFNVAGAGFDARISAAFAGNKKRGFTGYALMCFREIRSYVSQTYHITIDGVSYTEKAFILSIANSPQYGNEIYISPGSKLNDGLLEVCIIKPVSLFNMLPFIWNMWRSKKQPSKWVDIRSGKQIQIERPEENAVHLDGEPFFMGKTIEINIIPDALKVIGKL